MKKSCSAPPAPPAARRHGRSARCVAGSALAASALLLVAVACKRSPDDGRPAGAPPQSAVRGASGGRFVEESAARGLDFRTHFLPTEQGANFKINLYDHGSGLSFADVDGDGDDDLLLLDQLGPNALYRNDGGRFTNVTEGSGVALEDRIAVAAVFGDMDEDGDQDLYVTTTRGGNALLRNDGNFRFTDVSKGSGTDLVAHSIQPVLFDYDLDGDLDLFVTNSAAWTTEKRGPENRYFEGMSTLGELLESRTEPADLFRNEGNLRFTDVTKEAGIADPGWGGDVAVFDADADGDLDLYVANMFGWSMFHRNEGGHFKEATRETFGRYPWGAVGTSVFDANGDGRLDLLVLDMHSDMWMEGPLPADQIEERVRYEGPEGPMARRNRWSEDRVQAYRDRLRAPMERCVFGNALFLAKPDGTYADAGLAAGVETFWPWGGAAADFDLDGDTDVYVPTGMGYPFLYWPAALLENGGSANFRNRAWDWSLEPPPGGSLQEERIGNAPAARSSRAAAVADIDADGRPDLVVSRFNDAALLFRSDATRRNWVGMKLTATRSARDAIGAIVTVKAGGKTFVRQVPTAGGYLAQSSRTLHFGLGEATTIESCEILWPGGRKQTVTGLTAGSVHALTEPKDPK